MDNSSRIRMLISDLMDKGELRMCSVIREKSGSFLLKVRFDELNAQEDGCVGGVSLNTNMHFRRKSQKQFDRDINRADKRNSDSKQSHISSRTRSKIELARSDQSPGATDDISRTYFYGVASPDACHEPCSPSASSEEQPCVSVNDSPNPMDLATMHGNVNTADCDSSIHRVDSFMTEETVDITENALTAANVMNLSEETITTDHYDICDRTESPVTSIDTDRLADLIRRDLQRHNVFGPLRAEIRSLHQHPALAAFRSESSDCSDIT